MMMPPSGGWWVFPLLMPVVMIVFALFVLGVVRATFLPTRPARRRAGGHTRDGEARDGDDRPLSVLRQRYVRGEIDLEDLERRVELLVRNESVPKRDQLARRRE